MVKDAVTFGSVFVGYVTDIIFFRTHIISFSIFVDRVSSKLELWLRSVPHPLFFHLRINYVLDANNALI